MKRPLIFDWEPSLIQQADALTYLSTITAGTIDALITDPPAGISFMGKDWDTGKGFVEDMTEIFAECLRVLKPGAHGLVWALPRTSHWTATALEQAGFEIRDVVTHLFGTGFPKSLDVSKAIDKAAGSEREIIGKDPERYARLKNQVNGSISTGDNWKHGQRDINITAPSTPEAKQWEGWGTALKPASEHWILVRKPLGEKTVAKNVLKHGTGGINVDASRIAGPIPVVPQPEFNTTGSIYNMKTGEGRNGELSRAEGRFPANLILSHNEDCEGACTEGCAVAMLDAQSGDLSRNPRSKGKVYKSAARNGISMQNSEASQITEYGDIGGASRFFYCAKASKADRNQGLEGMPEKDKPTLEGGKYTTPGNTQPKNGGKQANHHPTVKSTKLMEYLIRLVTPPGGTVLDPFMGSGSTGVAAKRLGFGFVGIEREAEYFEIAKRRIGD